MMGKFLEPVLRILRYAAGVTFVVSGILKLVDPIGTGLIFEEYLTVFHLRFLIPASDVLGMFLSVLEFVTGLSLLTRIRLVVFSTAAMSLTALFTVITFILYRFSPIQDCGCFGEAIHLTNAQTFFKNLVLLVCTVPVFVFRKRFPGVTGRVHEWIFLSCHALVALALSVISLRVAPFVEFGDFRTGTNLYEKMDLSGSGPADDMFIYEKDGVLEAFPISEIPDSSWHFVESRSAEESEEERHVFDFAVTDVTGEYVTDSILHHAGPVFLFPVHSPGNLEDGELDGLAAAAAELEQEGCMARILLPGPVTDTAVVENVAYCDYRTLLSLSRSNGGCVYINDGIVAGKYPSGSFTAGELKSTAADDADEVTSRNNIREKLFLESLFLLVFLSILLFRYVCGLRHGRSPSLIG